MEKEYFSYREFDEFVSGTVDYLEACEFVPSVIVTFPRGGLVPATYLSHQLDVPIEIITSSKYDFKTNLSVSVEQMNRLVGKNVLIVDDIIDTGKTMDEFLKLVGNSFEFKIATLATNPEYYNPSIVFDWYFRRFKDPSKFLVFPWEKP